MTLWTLKSRQTTEMPVTCSMARKTASIGPSPQATLDRVLLVAAAQAERHLRHLAGSADHLVRIDRPFLGDGVDLLLDQRGDVGVVDLLLLVGQDLELLEDRVELLAGEACSPWPWRGRPGRPGRCACPTPGRSSRSRRPRAA